jgi:hypothetical protein
MPTDGLRNPMELAGSTRRFKHTPTKSEANMMRRPSAMALFNLDISAFNTLDAIRKLYKCWYGGKCVAEVSLAESRVESTYIVCDECDDDFLWLFIIRDGVLVGSHGWHEGNDTIPEEANIQVRDTLVSFHDHDCAGMACSHYRPQTFAITWKVTQ